MPRRRGPDTFREVRGKWGNRAWIVVGFLVATVVPLLPSLIAESGDCRIYRRAAQGLLSGVLPYRDKLFEYPPYALPFFLLPQLLSPSEVGFGVWFGIEMLAIDLFIKVVLLREARRSLSGWMVFVPCAIYALDGCIQSAVYLKRFDLVPSALVFGAVLLMVRGRALGAGAAIAAAIGVKAYGVLMFPPLLALAWRNGRARRFVAGAALGMLPLALLSLVLPWWRFGTTHVERGLQVESLAASVIWWLHLTSGAAAEWARRRAWYDLDGAWATATLPFAKAILLVATAASTAVATRRAARRQSWTGPALARLLLLPLVAFIAFNTVLSPQYLIWCFALLALGSIEARTIDIPLFLGAILATRFFFPSKEYETGLLLPRATALLVRNVALVAIWALLLLTPRPVAVAQSSLAADPP
jgi:hypothetical protein